MSLLPLQCPREVAVVGSTALCTAVHALDTHGTDPMKILRTFQKRAVTPRPFQQTLARLFKLHVSIYLWAGVWPFLSKCGNQETICRNRFSPSTTWVLETELWLSGLVASACILGASSLPTRTPPPPPVRGKAREPPVSSPPLLSSSDEEGVRQKCSLFVGTRLYLNRT